MNIGRFIHDALWQLKMTRAELGAELGKTPETISNWINGESEPRASEYEKIKAMIEVKDD